VRIAIDIDSTLHHYWDQFRIVAARRHGIELPYETHTEWGVGQLSTEQLREVVAETHTEEFVLAAEPYPHAVETVRGWHSGGHYVHITSHRSTDSHDITTRWLDQIGLPYDDLHCSYDKVTRCVELGIDILVDDSPVNMARAADRGIVPATIVHPWNRALCEARGFIAAADWRDLAAQLAPLLQGRLRAGA
jgi:uncharacterized HAD superfamily protein